MMPVYVLMRERKKEIWMWEKRRMWGNERGKSKSNYIERKIFMFK